MSSCGGMAVALAIMAATTATYQKTGDKEASSASIAFIYIFGVIFAVAFTPMQPIYPAEVLSSTSSIPHNTHMKCLFKLTISPRRYACQWYDGFPNHSRLLKLCEHIRSTYCHAEHQVLVVSKPAKWSQFKHANNGIAMYSSCFGTFSNLSSFTSSSLRLRAVLWRSWTRCLRHLTHARLALARFLRKT